MSLVAPIRGSVSFFYFCSWEILATLQTMRLICAAPFFQRPEEADVGTYINLIIMNVLRGVPSLGRHYRHRAPALGALGRHRTSVRLHRI